METSAGRESPYRLTKDINSDEGLLKHLYESYGKCFGVVTRYNNGAHLALVLPGLPT